MTRELKFRAFNPTDGTTYPPMTLLEIYEIAGEQQPASIDALAFKYAFHSLIFLQFTGLTDKEGKEIYEGDVIEFRFVDEFGGGVERGIVRWSKDGFWTTQEDGQHEELLGEELASTGVMSAYVVGSNTHPHLLTKDSNEYENR